jgi:O-antigen/teichoic acid export membrane protein
MQTAVARTASREPSSLRRAFSWSVLGNVAYVGCQWAILVLLARLGSPEMVGRFALGLAIAAPIMLFANLSLRTVQAAQTSQAYAFEDYLGLRIVTAALGLLGIATVALGMGYHDEAVWVIVAVGIAKTAEAVSDIIYGLLQRHERMDVIARSMMAKGALSAACTAAALALAGTALAATLALAAAWTTVLLCYDLPQGARLLRSLRPGGRTTEPTGRWVAVPRPRFAPSTLRRLAWLALPLGATTMLASLNANIPRYVIERYHGERELGIFAALAYLMVAGNTVIGALAQAALPKLSQSYAQARMGELKALTLKLVGCGAGVGLAGTAIAVVGGRSLLTLLYGPEYARHVDVFVVLSLAAGIGAVGWFLSYTLSAAGLFGAQLKINLGVAVVVLLGSALLVPRAGLLGAALAVCLAASAQVVALGVTVRRAVFGPVAATASPDGAHLVVSNAS